MFPSLPFRPIEEVCALHSFYQLIMQILLKLFSVIAVVLIYYNCCYGCSMVFTELLPSMAKNSIHQTN